MHPLKLPRLLLLCDPTRQPCNFFERRSPRWQGQLPVLHLLVLAAPCSCVCAGHRDGHAYLCGGVRERTRVGLQRICVRGTAPCARNGTVTGLRCSWQSGKGESQPGRPEIVLSNWTRRAITSNSCQHGEVPARGPTRGATNTGSCQYGSCQHGELPARGAASEEVPARVGNSPCWQFPVPAAPRVGSSPVLVTPRVGNSPCRQLPVLAVPRWHLPVLAPPHAAPSVGSSPCWHNKPVAVPSHAQIRMIPPLARLLTHTMSNANPSRRRFSHTKTHEVQPLLASSTPTP